MADWCAIPGDLLHLISQCLSTSIDLLRFRSVCHTWRAAVPSSPPAVAPRLIQFSMGHIKSSIFYLSKRSFYLLQLPLPRHSTWIIKLGCRNPVTLRPIDGWHLEHLPEALPMPFNFLNIRVRELGEEYTLKLNDKGSIIDWPLLHMDKVAILNGGRDGCVVLIIHLCKKLMVYRCGYERWSFINDMPDDSSPYVDIILWGGRFYAVDKKGRIVLVNSDDLKVSVLADVDNDGLKIFVGSDRELLLVVMNFTSVSDLKMRVFRLRADSMEWEETCDLGDKVVFWDGNSAVMASASEVFGNDKCRGNYIFHINLLNKSYVGAYDLQSGTCIGQIYNGLSFFQRVLASSSSSSLR